MSKVTVGLNEAFLRALGEQASPRGDRRQKPLEVDLLPPLPPRIRLYIYTLVWEANDRFRCKASVRLIGQEVGEYGTFDHSGDRLAILAAHRPDLDVFVLWDTSLRPRFKNGGNVQVTKKAVLDAAATGSAEQRRWLTAVEKTETVIVCQSSTLPTALERRVFLTGGDNDAVVTC